MDIDIVGSAFTRKLLDFKNFPFSRKSIIENQSILALFSNPLPTGMDALDTTDLEEIKSAYRDLNKTHLNEFFDTPSDFLLLDLYSELDDVCRIDGNYFAPSSFELLSKPVESEIMDRVEKFRAFQNTLDTFIPFLERYEAVILLKRSATSPEDNEYLKALYQLIENQLSNLLIISVGEQAADDDIPLEVHHETNARLKKLRSQDYHTQLLFEEKLKGDTLSIHMNYITPREYLFELYKDGAPHVRKPVTDERKVEFKLSSPGKYRIRVTAVDTDINPRFSGIYEYHPASAAKPESFEYIHLTKGTPEWCIDLLLETYDIKGFVGNPFEYPLGYKSQPVYSQSEVDSPNIIAPADVYEEVIHILGKKDQSTLDRLRHECEGDSVALAMIYFAQHTEKLEP